MLILPSAHRADREFDALKAAVSAGGSNDEGDAAAESTESANLISYSLAGQSTPVLLEVGCGVGNMLYPLLEKNPQLQVHCCDFSSRAVEIVKQHPRYDAGRVNAFVYDLCSKGGEGDEASSTSTSPPTPSLRSLISPPHSTLNDATERNRPTLISCIFVLSAVPPSDHVRVLASLFDLLAPGGTLLFRDYGRGDLAQLRFHNKAKWAEPSLLSDEYDYYRRGDGTMTFFFGVDYMQGVSDQLAQRTDASIADNSVKMVERIGQNRKRGIELKRRFVQAYWRKAA